MYDTAAIAERKFALDRLRPLPVPTVLPLVEWFETELALSDAALEGSAWPRETVLRVMADAVPTPGDDPAATLWLSNYRDAVRWLATLASDDAVPLSEETVIALHRLLYRRVAGSGGHYRDVAATARPTISLTAPAGAYTPPSPDRLPSLMTVLGRWLASVEPFPEAALDAHYRLARLQPFAVGNLIIGRMVMNLVLGRGGYPPIVIPIDHRAAYLEALEIAIVEGNRSAFRAFMLQLLEESLDRCLDAAEQGMAGEER